MKLLPINYSYASNFHVAYENSYCIQAYFDIFSSKDVKSKLLLRTNIIIKINSKPQPHSASVNNFLLPSIRAPK